MVPDNALLPNPEGIRDDLEYMTARWGELSTPAVFEIRAFKEGSQPQIFKYASDWIDEAVDCCVNMNELGFNIYVVRNPIRHDIAGSATDADILAAFFLWADCDDKESADNVKRFGGPKYSAAVVTGLVPSPRVHVYWALETPHTDMTEWRDIQTRIAGHFNSDKSVVNPSRIMRVGGTVAYPAKHKRERGYERHLTTIRTSYAEPRLPVTMEQMGRVFAPVVPAASSAFQIDTGIPAPLDRERTAIQALSGQEWNNAVLKLIGSYVRKGLSDAEIHALTDALTLGGYTVDQTRAEVQSIINRTRANPAFEGAGEVQETTPNFDHAEQPPEAAPAWSIQTAAEFTANFVAPEYLIDGVIQRGRLYTLTAPTGSGKTAVMLYVGTAMSLGQPVCERETEPGDVIYLAGENPDDVRARIIATMDAQEIDAGKCNLHFIPGTFSIRQDMAALKSAIETLPNPVLVVVDTLAAYFDGDDSNSNAQMLDFARVLRSLTTTKTKPAVIVPAHPIKNAAKTNLTPMGGSALLNEVDGNLCLWKRDTAVELHWQGKHRGPDFMPIMFELKGIESDKIKDSKGRAMPTVMAVPLLEMRAMEIAANAYTTKERLLLSIEASDSLSVAQRCLNIGMVNSKGDAKKSSLAAMLGDLRDEKLVKRILNNWFLTEKGERAVNIITNGGSFVEDAI